MRPRINLWSLCRRSSPRKMQGRLRGRGRFNSEASPTEPSLRSDGLIRSICDISKVGQLLCRRNFIFQTGQHDCTWTTLACVFNQFETTRFKLKCVPTTSDGRRSLHHIFIHPTIRSVMACYFSLSTPGHNYLRECNYLRSCILDWSALSLHPRLSGWCRVGTACAQPARHQQTRSAPLPSLKPQPWRHQLTE